MCSKTKTKTIRKMKHETMTAPSQNNRDTKFHLVNSEVKSNYNGLIEKKKKKQYLILHRRHRCTTNTLTTSVVAMLREIESSKLVHLMDFRKVLLLKKTIHKHTNLMKIKNA